MEPRVAAAVIRTQGLYDLLTGISPLVSMRAFEWVTGPKRDDWLVRTVGLLAAVIGAAILQADRRGRLHDAQDVGVGSALAFATVDIVGVATRTLRPVYLLDALAQLVFVAGWRSRRRGS